MVRLEFKFKFFEFKCYDFFRIIINDIIIFFNRNMELDEILKEKFCFFDLFRKEFVIELKLNMLRFLLIN